MTRARGRSVLLRPRWLAGHILALVVSIAFVALGLWQLGRHFDEQDAEAAARDEYAAPAPPLGAAGSEPESGMRVEVAGTYDARGEALLRGRVRDGEGGYDVLTPLLLPDGTAVVVDRGWVPRRVVDRDDAALDPPSGEVTVRGLLGSTRPLQADDTVDTRAGRTALPRVDLDRVQDGLSYELRDVYVTAQWQDPPSADGSPALSEPPDTDDVNHLSYALQWFAFALIPLVGWPLVCARVVRRPVPRRALADTGNNGDTPVFE
jgi:cytochrome oxidase assembly protein ShyY1